MFSKVKWRSWKRYSGPMIRGTTKYVLEENSSHWERIVWLTAQVETGGRFGATTCYDGTGNTSGIIQGIAVYPRELSHEDNNPADDQGPLWKMMEYIREDYPELLKPIEDEFKEIGWVIKGGHVKIINDDGSSGDPVNGRLIREELTPNQGRVPRSGQQWIEAKNWALMFHNVFNDPRSFNAQIRFGINHAKAIAKRKPNVLRGESIESLIYTKDIKKYIERFVEYDPMDLAMAVFFSNTVNAPAMAFRKFKQANEIFCRGKKNKNPDLLSNSDREQFAKRLIRVLGNANFGRWNFRIATGRYQRTRKAAMKVWPKEMFVGPTAIMPRQL